ncbi:hypothetical protein GOP47_0029352 [Adiantum capillus-veneris]|nr:hypothetical protein GOP47_0029352 [Adiantum capillus-veneris]
MDRADRGGQVNVCLKHGADDTTINCTVMKPIKAGSTDGADETCTSRVMGPRGLTCEPREDQRACEEWSERCHRRLHRDGANRIGKAAGRARVRRWIGVGG